MRNAKGVKSVFLAITKEDKEIYMPVFRELVKLHPDLLVYNSGPVCQEIKDRNVVVTTDRQRDEEIIKDFDCGCVCISKTCSVDQAISAIVCEAIKGGAEAC